MSTSARSESRPAPEASAADRRQVLPEASAADRRQVLLTFTGLLLAMLLASLDQTIVSTALPTIVGDLGGSHQLPWVRTPHLLGTAGSTSCLGSCPRSCWTRLSQCRSGAASAISTGASVSSRARSSSSWRDR